MTEKAKRKGGARGAALKALGRVDQGGFAEAALDTAIKKGGLTPEDTALATELAYGVLRHRGRLDYVIKRFSTVRLKKLERDVLNALRLGAYQLLMLSGVPARAAINETVELVKKGRDGRGRTGFVNAVLRKIDAEGGDVDYPNPGADPVLYLSTFYSHPEWLVRRWVERLGCEETEALLRANLEIPPRTLRVNTLATTKEKLARKLTAGGMTVTECRYSPQGLTITGGTLGAFEPGYYVQDEASQLVSLLVAPEPGSTVLDACAAPGGKATQLAAIISEGGDGRGEVYAVDLSDKRLEVLKRAAERLGAGNVRGVLGDATGRMEVPRVSSALVDAPCTGLGVLRRSPDIKYRRRAEDIGMNSERQGRILENVSGYVKPGGVLVYSVCSLEPEETEGVVEGFLKENPEYAPEDAAGVLPPACGELVDGKGYLRT